MSYRIRQLGKPGFVEDLVLLSRSERMWLVAEQYRVAVIVGILAVFLAVVALSTLFWVYGQREDEALTLDRQASEAYFDRPTDNSEDADESLKTATRLYRQILEDFPRTAGAQLTRYLLGNTLATQHDYAGAIDAYQHFIEQSGDSPALRGLVYQRLGAAYMANGEREQGLRAYDQVLTMPETLNKDQVIFELAKLEEHEEHTDQALAHYKRLVAEYPDSPFASEAALQVKSLEPPPDESETETETKNSEESGDGAKQDTATPEDTQDGNATEE